MNRVSPVGRDSFIPRCPLKDAGGFCFRRVVVFEMLRRALATFSCYDIVMLIIAHRGASRYERENTLAAFERAIELGADMCEFDVRRTADGQLVVIHDDTVGEMRLSEVSLAELREHPLGSGIPTLDEVLRCLAGRIGADIELKETGCEADVLAALHRSGTVSPLIVTSFHEEALAAIRSRSPETAVGLLLGIENPRHFIRTRVKELFPFCRARRREFGLLVPHWRIARLPYFLPLARRYGLRVLIWGDPPPSVMKRLSHGVVGYITDAPDNVRRPSVEPSVV